MVFVTSYISGQRKILMVRPVLSSSMIRTTEHISDFPSHCYNEIVTCKDILDVICQKQSCCEDICLSHEGKPVGADDQFEGDANIVATLKLKGGKGGFGSMLRAIGAQIEKTTNREACRDLSGRRLRDINEEKRLKDYLSKKVEKENEMLENKRRRLARLDEAPRHVFEDKAYFEQRERRQNDVYNSLDKAFAGGSKMKGAKKNPRGGNPPKKVRTKMMSKLDDLSSSSSSEEEEEEDEEERKGNEEEQGRSEEIPSKVDGRAEGDTRKQREEGEKIKELREEMEVADEGMKKKRREEGTEEEEMKKRTEEKATEDERTNKEEGIKKRREETGIEEEEMKKRREETEEEERKKRTEEMDTENEERNKDEEIKKRRGEGNEDEEMKKRTEEMDTEDEEANKPKEEEIEATEKEIEKRKDQDIETEQEEKNRKKRKIN